MADENSAVCDFDKLPEEILEKILCFLWTNYEQDKVRLVCKLWNRLLLRIRQQRHQIFLNAIKNGKLYFRKYDNNSRICPSPRSSHASCALKGNVCIFGGCSLSNTAYNDLYFFNVTDRKWTKPVTSGFSPVPRECATLVSCHDNLVLFGGCCQPPRSPIHLQGKFFNDVHLFNFCEKAWSTPNDIGAVRPCERAEHSASVVNDIMVVFGGAQGERRFCDVWCFNIQTKKWHCPNITGKKPFERFGHSQFTINEKNQKILILGGCGFSNTLFNDVWLLDVQIWSWHEIEVRQPMYAAPSLWLHPAIMVGNWVLVFANRTRARSISTLASLMTGIPPGYVKMYKLDCDELVTNHCCSWQPEFDGNKSILATCLHTVNVCDDMVFIFGGLKKRDDARTANNTLISVTSFISTDVSDK